MAIVKYPLRSPAFSAWREFDEPFNRLARLLDEPSLRANGAWSPAVSVSETKDALILTAELPGMSEDDITIELENNVLSISGEKSDERKQEGDEARRHHVWERSHGSFQRRFTLPRRVSGEEVDATFVNGVLTITLQKSPEAKSRRIEIAKS